MADATLTTMYGDSVFAPIDPDQQLERIAGGYESEVYVTDDRRFVVKLKHDLGGDRSVALQWARTMRAAAEQFADCIGSDASVASHYVVARDQAGQVQVLVIQSFLAGARPLDLIDYRALTDEERHDVAHQLRTIIRRSLEFYRNTGALPDLYGRTSRSASERRQHKSITQLPERLWSFLIKRTLLNSHNLLLTDEIPRRIVLIDYDIVRRNRLYRWIYFNVRRILFWRDLLVIRRMERGQLA